MGGCLGARLASRFPAGRAGRSGSPPAPDPCLRPGGQARAVRLCGGCCLPNPFFLTSPTRALANYSLYFSPFPCELPRQRRNRPLFSPARASPARPAPPRPTVPADPRVRSAPPWLCRGVGPSRGGDNQWAAESKGSWAGTLGFPSPTFLSLPTGMCSSFSRRLAPRGSTTWGPKNYKSLHPPRRKRERRGAGRSGAQRLEMGSNKGNGGERLCLPDAGHFAHYTPSLPNLCSNPARHCCIQFRERSTCQRSRSAPVVMRLNPEP